MGVGRAFLQAMARRPVVPVALAFIGGILVERQLPVRPGWWITAGLLAAAIAVVTRRVRALPSTLLLIAVACAGLTAAQWERYEFGWSDIAQFTTDGPRLAQLELRIISPPRLLADAGLARPLPPKQVAKGRVLRVRTVRGWESAEGDVNLTVDQPHPELAIGQVVVATGMLQRPMSPTNPGQTDWAEFYRQERVLALLNVPHADAVQIVRRDSAGPLEYARAKVRSLLADGFTADRKANHALLEALTLGDRDATVRDAQDDFARSGTAHLLAVSGLHVVLVGALALGLLGRVLGLHPRTATFGAVVVVLLYAAVVVPGTPALRATVLCLAYGVNRLARRRPDGLQLLGLCALGLLIWHPHDLLSVGFQLSFVTVAGIILAGRRVAEFLASCVEDEHARVARSFRPPTGWSAAGLACRGWLIDVTAMSLVAWAVSLPLVMIHFGMANLWAVATGLLALPLVVIGLAAGLLKVVLTLALPSAAGLWATCAVGPIALLRWTVHVLAAVPGAGLPAPPPSPWRVAAIYALLALPLLPWGWAFVRRWVRCSPAAGCAVALIPVFFGGPAVTQATDSDDVRVTLLSIGAGQVGVIELPGHRAVLVDDGSSSVPDPLRQCLAPYLRYRGVRRVEAIILSHPDFDHVSAAAETCEAFRPARVIVSPMFRGQAYVNTTAGVMLDELEKLHVPIEITSRGQQIALGDGAAIDVLWPPAGRRITSTNNAGLVLRLTARGRSVLFPADIQVPTERELLQTPDRLRSDVLVAPHHGSAEVSTADFLAAVHPLDVLSSNDRRLSKKQKDFDRVAEGVPLYRTSRFGAVSVCIGKDGSLRIEAFVHPEK